MGTLAFIRYRDEWERKWHVKNNEWYKISGEKVPMDGAEKYLWMEQKRKYQGEKKQGKIAETEKFWISFTYKQLQCITKIKK